MSRTRRKTRRKTLYPPYSQRGRKNAIWFNRFGPVPVVPCHWCDAPLTFNQATVDHVVPRCGGGGNGWDNFVLSCYACNQWRNRLHQFVGGRPDYVRKLRLLSL